MMKSVYEQNLKSNSKVRSGMRLLVIEDDPGLADGIVDLFTHQGYECDVTSTAFAGIEKGMTFAYDCLIVDVQLPDGNGIDVVAELRQLGSTAPVLVLTVQNEPLDRVRGLNAGADDYLGKPFDTEELMARVNALIRRSSALQEPDKLTYGKAQLHRNSRTLQVGEHVMELSGKEFMLLEYLFRNPGQVLSRDQLVAHVWGPEAEIADSALDTYVYFLRKKAAQLGWRRVIKTVRGQGYSLGPKI